MDIKAHSPLAFIERPVDKEEEEIKLKKQKEALAYLGSFFFTALLLSFAEANLKLQETWKRN